MSLRPIPLEIKQRRADRLLEITFDDQKVFRLPYQFLRITSPSAEVQGHGGQKPPPVTGKENINLIEIQPVGNYAVRLVFDDGHNSGLYSWDYLYSLGINQNKIWADYLTELEQQENPKN